jgi:RNA polymerase sigma factor (sigma-70 family)
MLCETTAVPIELALARLRAGEGGAFDDLIRLAYDWLGRRVAALLRSYPSVRLPPDEVLHDRVLARLRTALASATPPTCEELARLADRHIRWALRDLVREQRGRTGVVSIEAASGVEGGWEGPADPTADGLADFLDHCERAEFHSAAAALPEPLRRVFCLRYYGGLSEAEVATDLGVSDRTVRSHWRQAIDAISVALTGSPFEGDVPRLRREGEAAGSPLCTTRGAGRPSGDGATPPPAGPAPD